MYILLHDIFHFNVLLPNFQKQKRTRNYHPTTSGDNGSLEAFLALFLLPSHTKIQREEAISFNGELACQRILLFSNNTTHCFDFTPGFVTKVQSN